MKTELQNINISAWQLIEKVTGISIPKESRLPNFILTDLEGGLKFDDQTFYFKSAGNLQWKPFNNGNIEAQASISIARTKENGKFNNIVKLNLKSDKTYSLLGGISLSQFDFTYTLINNNWEVTTNLSLNWFENLFALTGKMQIGEEQKLSLNTSLRGNAAPIVQAGPFSLKDVNFNLELNLKQQSLSGSLIAATSLMSKAAKVSGYLVLGQLSQWKLAISSEDDYSLNQLQKQLFKGDDLPLDIDVILSRPAITLDMGFGSTGKLFYHFGIGASIDGTAGDSSFLTHLSAHQINFKQSLDEKGIHASLVTKGRLNVNDVLVIDDFDIDFKYESSNGGKHAWGSNTVFKGVTIDTPIAKTSFDLRASLKVDEDRKSFMLNATSKDIFKPISIGDDFNFQFANLSADLSKEKGKSLEWSLSASSSLSTPLFSYEKGKVNFIKKGNNYGLSVGTENLSLKFPGDQTGLPHFVLSQPKLELNYDGNKKSWSCGGETGLYVEQLPEILKGLLPTANDVQKPKAYFLINNKVATLGLQDIKLPFPSQIDGVDLGGLEVDMDPVVVGFSVNLSGNELSTEVGFGLPKQINQIFNTSEWNEEKNEFVKKEGLAILKTFDPSKPDRGMVRLKMGILKDRLGFKLCSIPFNLDVLPVEETKTGLKISSESLGEFSFDWPELAISGISVKGIVNLQVKDLKIPTSPAKLLLRQIGLEEVSKNINPSIPLMGVNFAPLDGKERKFDMEAFEKLFTANNKGIPKPDWFAKTIGIINQFASRLPNSFLEYGELKVPEHLYLDIDYNVTQSLNFKFSVNDPNSEKKGEPLKVLFPDPSFTQVFGMQIRSISLGEFFSGTLFRLDIDAIFDAFDIRDLAASLAIDPEWSFAKNYLPDPKGFINRMVLKDVVFLIIHQTRIPIPVPVFYNEIGFYHSNALGVEVGAAISFPMPELGLGIMKDIALIGTQILRLFQGKELQLDKLDDIKPLFQFKVLSNYIRIPKYISREELANDEGIREGSLIGSEDGVKIYRRDGKEMNSVRLFTSFLKAIKEKSFNTFLTEISLSNRIGGIDLKLFDVLKIRSDYAFVTPGEFVNQAFNENVGSEKIKTHRQLDMEPSEREHFLEVLPKDNERGIPDLHEDTEGLIILNRGEVSAPDNVKFIAGLVFAANEKGLGIALNLEGKLAPLNLSENQYLLDTFFKGVFRIEEEKLLVKGEGHMSILGINALKGSYQLDNTGFEFHAQVGEENLPLYVKGDLKGVFTSEKFHLEGEVNFKVLSFKSEGKLLILFSGKRNEFLLSGSFQLGSLVKLESRLAYLQKENQQLAQWSLGGDLMNGLISIHTEGSLSSAQGLSFSGKTSLKLGDYQMLLGQCNYQNDQLEFSGHLSLFPETVSKFIRVKGEVKGFINTQQFSISSGVEVRIANLPFLNSHLAFNQDSLSITGNLFKQKLVLQMDTNQGLSAKMSPIHLGPLILLGKQQQSQQDYDRSQSGPALIIARDRAIMQTRMSFMGIEREADIQLEQGSYIFKFKSTIGGIKTDELTIKGNSFSPDSVWIISGQIMPEGIIKVMEKELVKIADEVQAKLKDALALVNIAKEKVTKATRAIEDNITAQKEALEQERQKAVKVLQEAEKYLEQVIKGEIRSCSRNIADINSKIGVNKPNWPWDWPEWLKNQGELLITKVFWEGKKKVLEGLEIGAETAVFIAKRAVNGLTLVASISLDAIDEALKVMKQVADEMLNAASVALQRLEQEVGKFKDLSQMIARAREKFLQVHSISFTTTLDKFQSDLLLNAKVSVLNQSHEYGFYADFSSPSSFAHSLVANIQNNQLLPSSISDKGVRKTSVEMVEKLLQVYPNLEAIQLSLTMKKAKYSLPEIGEALRFFIKHQKARSFPEQVDNRRQIILKALRIAQQEQVYGNG